MHGTILHVYDLNITKLTCMHNSLGGGYSLYSDDRDDRRIFRGYNQRFGIS